MQILKGYVFRMYPTKEQEELINKTIGCSRFIYNYFLDNKIKEYKIARKSKSAYDQIKLIPSLSIEKPWLKEVDSCALRTSLFNLEDAYKRVYNGSGYPRFKAKRGLSRCKKGSKNRYKMKLKTQRLYQKIRNARKHMIHDITNKLINENDIIVTDNLDVKSMQKNHYVAKGLNENPISEIIRLLKYKANFNNKKLIQIDRYYPSSQICNVCNYQNKEVKDLSIRSWECPVCHTEHERDYNAAVNIMFKGLEKYMLYLEQGI